LQGMENGLAATPSRDPVGTPDSEIDFRKLPA
jgi:hypothetical protein